MKTSTTNRFVYFAVAAVAAVLGASTATAAPKPGVPVLDGTSLAASAGLPARAKTQSSVVGTLSAKALSASSLEFTLADGQKVTATLQRVARDDHKGNQSWVGTFEDSPGSLVVLSKSKGVVTGYGTYQDKTFELLPSAGGKHVLFTVDDKRLPQAPDRVERTTLGGAAALTSSTLTESGTATTAATEAGAVVHDVLMVYSSSSAARWGAATLESMIQNAVQAANQAYINSYVNVTVNVVGIKQVALREYGGMYGTMPYLEKDAEVQGLRKSLGADMVVFVNEDADYCGYAKLTQYFTNGVTTWWDANAIVYSSCLSNQTVAHELGHLQGLDHNRENTAYSGWYPYSYGYRRCTTDGFLDIMSYPCSIGVPKISVFSNPSVTYNGYATGVSYNTSPSTAAESARTLNETAATVAGYLTSTTTVTVPASPSSLAASSVAYNGVGLTWADNATNESGYKVERSTDGVTFGEIASLGAGVRSFTDASVAASSGYYYRVRAYNSAGASGYSNTVSVSTPAAPAPVALPTAPSSVVAANQANGSALVSWAASTTNVSSFEVRRETWDSRKQAWGRTTIAGTVPATVLSMVDSTNNGTFRYFVRAVNSGGRSGEGGPAQVTVSGGSNAKRR